MDNGRMNAKALLVGFFTGLFLAIGIAAWPDDEFYVGAAAGTSSAELPASSRECGNCIHGEMHTHAPVYQAFAGYDFGRFALEAGAGTLSGYRSHNIRTTGDIRQEIDTRDLFARGLFFLSTRDLRPFLSLGLARVSMKNHEYGWNDPSMKFVEQVNYDVRTRPIFGLGAEYSVTPKTALRVTATRINNVAISHWTLSQNVSSVWLGISRRL